jgi:hypothetical protein
MGGPSVHTWHIADVPLALTNVCFEGKIGHGADLSVCPLMTHSGRQPHSIGSSGGAKQFERMLLKEVDCRSTE